MLPPATIAEEAKYKKMVTRIINYWPEKIQTKIKAIFSASLLRHNFQKLCFRLVNY